MTTELETCSVDKNNDITQNCTFFDERTAECNMFLLSRHLEDIEKVSPVDDDHLKYITRKLKQLRRKINIDRLRLITNSSVTEETQNIIDPDVEDALQDCEFTEELDYETDVLVLAKYLDHLEKLTHDEYGYFRYIGMKIRHLQIDIYHHRVKLTTCALVTDETESIFDTYVEEALSLVTTLSRLVTNIIRRMETHKSHLCPTEIYLMRMDNKQLLLSAVNLCDAVEKTNAISQDLTNKNCGDVVFQPCESCICDV
jgi:hypothetical protein